MRLKGSSWRCKWDNWRQRYLKWYINSINIQHYQVGAAVSMKTYNNYYSKSYDNVKQKSWIRWSMSFKSRKCNGLPVVSPELAELRNSSALTPKWSERGSFDTGVRISSNSLYWLSVRQGDISQSRYTIQNNWKSTHFSAIFVFN